jgi:hypothetical protein
MQMKLSEISVVLKKYIIINKVAKKSTLPNFLVSFFCCLGLFLCMNLTQATTIYPNTIGTCFMTKSKQMIKWFVYRDSVFSTFGPGSSDPTIVNEKVQAIQGIGWSITQIDSSKSLWRVNFGNENLTLRCEAQKLISPSDKRLAEEGYKYFIENMGSPDSPKNPLKLATYSCLEPIDKTPQRIVDPDAYRELSGGSGSDDEDDHPTQTPREKKTCPGCCAIS